MMRSWALAAVLSGVCAAATVRADEVILRDGRKLSGTITGIERGVCRLETDYGVVLVRQDRIARIEFTVATETSSAAAANTAPPAPVRAAPPPPPAPPVVRERRAPGGRVEEHTEGTTYVNDTFRFELFKPPTWKVLDYAVKGIPSAVAALGTPDEATVLVVGTVLYEGPPGEYARILEGALRKSYSDYAADAEEQSQIAGRPAIRRPFRGMAGGHQWYGQVVNLADGSVHFGIIGITRAENFEFKEGVIAKVVNSFRFRQ